MRFEALTVTSSGPQAVVTTAEALAQLHLDEGFDDAKVEECVSAAVSYCETALWQSLRPQTITASYSPDGSGYAELMRAAFDELVSVRYYDAAGALQNMDVSGVIVDPSLFVPRAYFAEPQTSASMFAPIKIEYTTKAAGSLAPEIKQAVLIAAAQFYDDRNAPDLSAVDRILAPLRTRYFL